MAGLRQSQLHSQPEVSPVANLLLLLLQSELQQVRSASEQQATALQADLSALQQRLAAAEAELEAAQKHVQQLEQQLHSQQAEAAAVEKQMAARMDQVKMDVSLPNWRHCVCRKSQAVLKKHLCCGCQECLLSDCMRALQFLHQIGRLSISGMAT